MARPPSLGKTLIIVLALVLAGGATYAIYAYVQGIEQRAFEDAELVEVFVAEGEIGVGLSAQDASEAGLIVREATPRTAVPDGAVGELSEIDGLVALERVLPGEVLLRARWGDPGDVVGRELSIPDGFEAVSVQVGLVPGVAGHIRSGDRISMVVTIEQPTEDEDAPDDPATGQPEEEEPEFVSRYLLQDVEVLGTGQRASDDPEAEQDDGTVGDSVVVTVALEQEDIERLVFADSQGALYFTLLPEDAEPQETPGRTLSDLFDE